MKKKVEIYLIRLQFETNFRKQKLGSNPANQTKEGSINQSTGARQSIKSEELKIQFSTV